jgi:hypothetical protein
MVCWWVLVHCGLFSPFFFSTSSDREATRIVIYGVSSSPSSTIILFFSHQQSLSISFFTTPIASSFILNNTGRFLLQSLHSFCFAVCFCEFVTFLLHNQFFTLPSSFQTQTHPVLHTLATSPKKSLKDPCCPVVKN